MGRGAAARGAVRPLQPTVQWPCSTQPSPSSEALALWLRRRSGQARRSQPLRHTKPEHTLSDLSLLRLSACLAEGFGIFAFQNVVSGALQLPG